MSRKRYPSSIFELATQFGSPAKRFRSGYAPSITAGALEAGRRLARRYFGYGPTRGRRVGSRSALRVPPRSRLRYTGRRRRRRSVMPRPARRLQRFVKRVIKESELDQNVNVERRSIGTSWTCVINSCNYHAFDISNRTSWFDIVDTSERAHFDPTSGTLVRRDANLIPTQGTIPSHFRTINQKWVFRIRNNNNHPCWLTTMRYLCIRDGHYNPYSLMQDSINEKMGAGHDDTAWLTNRSLNIFDGNNSIKRHWRCYSSVRQLINAGDEIVVTVGVKVPRYWIADTEQQNQYVKNHSKSVVFRLEGCVVHDATSVSEVGTANCVLDVVIDKHFRWVVVDSDKAKFLDSADGLGAIVDARATISDVDEDAQE